MFRKVITSTKYLVKKPIAKNSLLKVDRNALRINKQFISATVPKQQKEEVTVTFIRANGERITTKGKVGDHLLDVVVNNNIDLDGFGACEGTLTCSTCHLIFKKEDFDRLPEKAGDEELDMLDLAYDLTDTSRLGCQITLTKNLDGLEVKVPATINDARS
ncbi:Adrenodoxin-like protein 2, mitochondrial [Pseudolycoriella hygida]|uniref:Adrenodoxin-like protein 2, mitochondrial n=1 Tax=Pseudolycoriella hygida TaxID=35572 RepID=A0A9Q0MM31_9DIPT|nr:Adrenodoxin-like protein 2, mitochondrial [Pseudolycoriella hygida]